jgi:putative DNA primase/helicase
MYLPADNSDRSLTHTPEIIAQNLRADHSAKLRSSALSDADIIDCKFFSNQNKSQSKRLTGYNLDGLLIPYFDPNGEPYKRSNGKPFYRIRPDWHNDPDADEKPKYLSPKGEGNRPYFAPTYKQWAKCLRFKKIPIHLTESEFKAASLGAAGYAAIGLCGVHGFTDRSTRVDDLESIPAQLLEDGEFEFSQSEKLEISQILPELEFVNNSNIWEGRRVYISFDSDIVHKPQVKHALLKLSEWLNSKGAEPYIVLIPSELNGDKNGVDDLLFRHDNEAFELLLKRANPALNWRGKKKSLNLERDPILPAKANLLQSVLKDHWRYRPGIGWHRWTGTHWQLTEDGRSTHVKIDIYRFMESNGWNKQGGGNRNDLLDHMTAKLMVEDWNPKHLLAFTNGVLDLTSMEFRPELRREDFITVLLPYRYDPAAKCPTWERFLSEALKGDDKAIALVQAFFKYAILPKAPKKSELEVCWDLYGAPGTGKGTLLDTLTQIVGAHNCGSFSTKTFNNDNALGSLIDKPVSICRDASGHLDDVGQFNSLISNEPIQIKILYKNYFTTTLNTFFVRAYNDFITAPSASQGLNRRIVAMHFSNRPQVKDETLGSKLEAELSGIFNWACSISHAEMKRRILWAGEVEAVAEASIERFYANNPAFVFLSEHFPDGTKAKIGDIYASYSEWSKKTGRIPANQRLFATSILNFGVYQEAKIHGLERYVIPAMKDFDVVRHLGISTNALENDRAQKTPILPERGEKGEKGEKQKSVIPPSFPTNAPDTATVSDKKGEKGEKGEKLSPKSIEDKKTGENGRTTKTDDSAKGSINQPLDSTPQPPASKVSPNPKGTITYQKLLRGEIGTTVIRFEQENIARDWQKFIYQVFGYDGSLELMAETQDGFNWKLIFDNFDKKALERLEQKDLSKPVPKRT